VQPVTMILGKLYALMVLVGLIEFLNYPLFKTKIFKKWVFFHIHFFIHRTYKNLKRIVPIDTPTSNVQHSTYLVKRYESEGKTPPQPILKKVTASGESLRNRDRQPTGHPCTSVACHVH